MTVDVHPDQGFDLVYYADVGMAIARAALTPTELASPLYHVGGGRITTMAEFAAAIESAIPGSRITMGERFPPGRNCRFDLEVARRDLGYQPAFDLRRALADLLARHDDAAARPPDR